MDAERREAEDKEIDILVLGAGAAGLSAALFAAVEGMEVLICEKSGQVGGTAATSAGTIWVPGSSQAARSGFADSKEEGARFLNHEVEGLGGADLRRAYLETASHAVDHLEAHSEVRFEVAARHPDYHEGPGSAVGGRALTPLPFDGRLLKGDFALVRPPMPEFMLFGGMMVSKFDITHLLNAFRSPRSAWHALRLVGRHAIDRLRYRRGTRLVMGNALIGRLFYSVGRRKNVELWFNSKACELLREGGTVAGAVIEKEGRRLRIHARRGVILASGGFPNSAGLRAELLNADMSPQKSLAYEGNVGDGLKLARSVGGTVETEHQSALFQMPISLMRRADGTEARYPHIYLDRAKPGLIAVNGLGVRFTNEADSYHDFVLAMYANPAAVPAYLVCNGDFIHAYGLGLIHPRTRRLNRFVDAGYLHEGQTIRELARKIGVDPDALEQTTARYNHLAATGVDEDFDKGGSELNRFNGDPDHKPNPCVGPVGSPPYYALAVWPGDIGTSLGIRTDVDGAVLDDHGAAVPNLYACGNDMSSVMRGTYPGPGITLGPAIAFAYRAVTHASGKPHVIGRNEAV